MPYLVMTLVQWSTTINMPMALYGANDNFQNEGGTNPFAPPSQIKADEPPRLEVQLQSQLEAPRRCCR